MIELVGHAETPAPWVSAIRVSAALTADGALELRYRLAGERARLLIPEPAAPERVEGLWRHTCCEAFVMGADAPAYREFNFSPSGAWQAYAFQAYRQAGPPTQAIAPRIVREQGGTLSLYVLLPRQDLPPGASLRIGLSAVIEAEGGGLSYWALRHPSGRPDFHHPDCFALELARP
jgi:hypothetical protein